MSAITSVRMPRPTAPRDRDTLGVPELSMRLNFCGAALFSAVLVPCACSPGSEVPLYDTLPSSSSSGSGGEGGLGPGCDGSKDADTDNVADALELAPDEDTDGDGKPDAQDGDSDGDTIADSVEASNALLAAGTPGASRQGPCDPLADTDADGTPDLRDLDSDNDGVPDAEEAAYDPNDAHHCRVLLDCDGDGVIDIIEAAAGTDPTDPSSKPADPGLYFVLPYQAGEKTKDFDFS